MPRGFLVRRNKNFAAATYRSIHRCPDFDDDKLTGCTGPGGVLVVHCFKNNPYDSPDSGYGSCPVTPVTGDQTPATRVDKNTTFSPSCSVFNAVSYLSATVTTPSKQKLQTNFDENEKHFSPIIKIPTTPAVASTPKKCSSVRKRPHSSDPCTGSPSKPHRATVKKPKAARKINFDSDDRSPVLGTFIRASCDVHDKDEDGTTSGKMSDNGKLRGLFVCKLCREDFHDPLSLAQHKCSRIAHVEYRCPECGKVFNCHANLASHRRWHKPKPILDLPTNSPSILPPSPASPESSACSLDVSDSGITGKVESAGSECSSPRSTPSPTRGTTSSLHRCEHCGKTYRRPANLRRHLRQHGEAETHPCFNCGQTFSSLTGRTKHVLSQVCRDTEDSG